MPVRNFIGSIKQAAKDVLPPTILNWQKAHALRKAQEKYKNLTTKEVFSKIYEEGVWGKPERWEGKYCSGSGSHDPLIVGPYVQAVTRFLQSLGNKPDVVDLGCGDFSVGSKVRHLCSRYVACDIVDPVIALNKEKYGEFDVGFLALDITKDELPDGDVVFVRQVFQHLPNDKILDCLPKIVAKYKHLILTEHLPATQSFAHNIDKPAGPDIRLYVGSGLVLTSAPFNLQAKSEIVLCEVREYEGVIRTSAYQF